LKEGFAGASEVTQPLAGDWGARKNNLTGLRRKQSSRDIFLRCQENSKSQYSDYDIDKVEI
jgi:hypothetical protein